MREVVSWWGFFLGWAWMGDGWTSEVLERERQRGTREEGEFESSCTFVPFQMFDSHLFRDGDLGIGV